MFTVDEFIASIQAHLEKHSVYLGLHDKTKSYDLMKKEIVEDDEKWS